MPGPQAEEGGGPGDQQPGTWFEYRRLVLNQLSSLAQSQTALRDHMDKSHGELRQSLEKHNKEQDDDVSKLRERIAIVETKAAALGFAAGLAVSILAAVAKRFL